MASLKAARRSDPFRQHNPTVPRYSPRLSEEQWEALKPRIAEMYEAGWTCVDILKELKSIDVPLTRSQLDFRLKKWKFVRSNQHQDRHGLRELEGMVLSDAPPLQRQPTNFDIHSLPSEGVAPFPPPPPHSYQVAILSSKNSNPDYEPLPFEQSEHSGTTDSFLEEMRQPKLLDTFEPEMVESSHPSKSVAPISPTSSACFSPSKLQDLDHVSNSSISTEQSLTLSGEGTCPPAQARKAIVSYPRFRFPRYKPSSRVVYSQLRLPQYELSSTVQNLWLYGLSSTAQIPWRLKPSSSLGSSWRPEAGLSGRIPEMLPAIASTALSLSDMKCFSEAFEVWYLITSGLNNAILGDQLLGPLLIFAASTCARSARTIEQLLIADALAEQLCLWRDRRFFHGQERPLSSELRAELSSILDLAEGLLVKDHSATAHWAATHYSANIIRTGKYLDKETRFGAVYEKKSLWTKDLRDWPKDVLDSFFASYAIQNLMLKALDFIETCTNSWTIIDPLEKHWPPTQDTSATFAQALACLVLEEYRTSTTYGPRTKPVPAEPEELYIRFEEQALAILPFVIVHWIQRSEALRNMIAHGICNCSSGLYIAVQLVRQALDRHSILKIAEYQELVDVYLEQLMNHETGDPSLRIFHGDRFVHAAAALAGIAIQPRREWSDRPPVQVSAVSSESDRGTEMEIGQSKAVERLSISSSIVDPPMARSNRSSMSSGFRSLKALSSAIRLNGSITNLSIRTKSTGRSSDHMSWRFSTATGFSSSSSVRQSTATDILIDGIEEEEEEEEIFGTENVL